MAKPNYQFEKRQRELAKQKKKQEKEQEKALRKAGHGTPNDAASDQDPESGSEPGEPGEPNASAASEQR
ncbi:hypothetical protein [Roseateles chitosanitabidus]|jgi:hypothetical protein|uniref:hypothetical protein n=1 Tax=Roseateles chitosanitabidus TaxID=65048 RepID=UPI00082A8F4F|nr:hypothetical protein [Roseateles chitosanitabidus]MBO9689075.1 hypothetical protein [Roseateles chitosanitabidus]